MGPLSTLSAVIVVIWVPVLIFSFRIVASSKDSSWRWTSLVICALCRLTESILLIALELSLSSPSWMYTIRFILDVWSSFFLVICTFHLMTIIEQGAQCRSLSWPGLAQVYRAGASKWSTILISLVPLVWTVLLLALEFSQSLGSWITIAEVGPPFVVLLYILTTMCVVMSWFDLDRMLYYRKRLLVLVTVTLPFIAVRTVYGVLSVFSTFGVVNAVLGGSEYTGINSVPNFGMFGGDFRIYLVMDILMECVVVIIYTVAGITFPLDEDYRLTDGYPFPRLQHLGNRNI